MGDGDEGDRGAANGGEIGGDQVYLDRVLSAAPRATGRCSPIWRCEQERGDKWRSAALLTQLGRCCRPRRARVVRPSGVSASALIGTEPRLLGTVLALEAPVRRVNLAYLLAPGPLGYCCPKVEAGLAGAVPAMSFQNISALNTMACSLKVCQRRSGCSRTGSRGPCRTARRPPSAGCGSRRGSA